MRRFRPCHPVSQIAAVVACLSLAAFVDAKPPKSPGGGSRFMYTLVQLPNEAGNTNVNGYANELHELRDAAGNLTGVDVVGILEGRAFYWRLAASGAVLFATPLPPPDGVDPAVTVSVAHAINDSGLVAGNVGKPGSAVACVWPSSLKVPPIALPLMPDFQGNAYAIDINNQGVVVGWLQDVDDIEYIVAWGLRPDGSVAGPLLLGVGAEGWTPDINDAGVVVASVNYQALRWQLGWDGKTLSVLTTDKLFAKVADGSGNVQLVALSTATAVNEHGDICGTYQPDGWQAYLLTAGGVLIDMPYLVDTRRVGTRNYQANDLNDAASIDQIQVTGAGQTYQKNSGIVDRLDIPLLWQGSQAIDLQKVTEQPASDLFLKYFGAVGDAGWLSGFGWTAASDPRAIVLVRK